MLLTDVRIRGAKPKKKLFRLKDGDGLHLLVRPNGKKFWQLRYRFLDKEKTISLGKYPHLSLSDAREKRIDAQRLLIDGKDPSTQRKQEKVLAVFQDRNSFGSVCEEWIERNRDIWVARHTDRLTRRMKIHVLPKIGTRPISEISPLEMLTVIQAIESNGTRYTAYRTLQICGAIFNFAIVTGRAQVNITIGLSSALKPHREKHYPTLTSRELPEFFQALEVLNTSPQNKLAFEILLLTALRTGELRFSKWTDLDIERREWIVPAEITKMRTAHTVPLSDQVLKKFEDLKILTGHSEWLFPNQQKQIHPVMSENTINQMVSRMGYKGKIVGHGFRSLFSTILNENGFNRDAIERQLAHMERNRIRAAYNRAEYMEERREMMQWWADFIARQKRG